MLKKSGHRTREQNGLNKLKLVHFCLLNKKQFPSQTSALLLHQMPVNMMGKAEAIDIRI